MTDIGIKASDRKAVAAALIQTLADTYGLYAKTHAYHWNVEGPRFRTLHLMFEEQYNALWMSLDTIAERIRSLGTLAPTFAEMAKKSTIVADNGAPASTQMVQNLLKGYEDLAKSAHGALKKADSVGDDATADLMTAHVAMAEKTAWMLRATAAEE